VFVRSVFRYICMCFVRSLCVSLLIYVCLQSVRDILSVFGRYVFMLVARVSVLSLYMSLFMCDVRRYVCR